MCLSFLPTRLTPVKMVKGNKLKCDHFGLICCSGKEKAMLGGNSYYRFGYFLSESESCSVMSNSSIPWNSSGQNTGVGRLSLLQGIFPTQGLNPGLPHSRQILYHLSHRGSPRVAGVCSLSLLQWIFLTQELNQGLLHCRWILYQLSYQGSPQ